MTQVVDLLLGLHGPLVYVAVTALVFLEAAALFGLLVPGEATLLVAGVLAANGSISILAMVALAGVAVVLGDSAGYWLGRLYGPHLQRSRAGRWVGPARWQRADTYVRERGVWAVVAGRWVGLLRSLVPAAAGIARMPYRRFLGADTVGGLVWVSAVLALGYGAGGTVTAATSLLGTVSAVTGAVVVAMVALLGLRARRSARSARSTGPTTSVTEPATPAPVREPCGARC